jgi:hypothetical protein
MLEGIRRCTATVVRSDSMGESSVTQWRRWFSSVSADLRPEDKLLISRLTEELEQLQPSKLDVERSSVDLTHFNDPAVLVVEVANSTSPEHGVHIAFSPEAADVVCLGSTEPFYRQDDEGESVDEFIGKIIEFIRSVLRRETAVDTTYRNGEVRLTRALEVPPSEVAEEERPVPWSWLPGRRSTRIVRRRLDLGQIVPPDA